MEVQIKFFLHFYTEKLSVSVVTCSLYNILFFFFILTHETILTKLDRSIFETLSVLNRVETFLQKKQKRHTCRYLIILVRCLRRWSHISLQDVKEVDQAPLDTTHPRLAVNHTLVLAVHGLQIYLVIFGSRTGVR